MVTIEIDDKLYDQLKKVQEKNEDYYPTMKLITKEVINQGIVNIEGVPIPPIEGGIIPHGDKTIKFAIHLLTDNIPEIKGLDNKKIAHDRGVVFAFRNISRDIGSTKPIHFNKLSELPNAIIETIERANITIIGKDNKLIELNEKLICGDVK